MPHDITFSSLVRHPEGVAMTARCSCGWARLANEITANFSVATMVWEAKLRRNLIEGHDVADLHRTSRNRAAQ